MSNSDPAISSPCVGVCTMNAETELCAGCYRTIEEIRQWWDMSDEQRADLINQLEQRQIALFD